MMVVLKVMAIAVVVLGVINLYAWAMRRYLSGDTAQEATVDSRAPAGVVDGCAPGGVDYYMNSVDHDMDDRAYAYDNMYSTDSSASD